MSFQLPIRLVLLLSIFLTIFIFGYRRTQANFGVQLLGNLNGFVYDDANNSGSRDTGEANLANVTVTIQTPGQPDRTTTTNSNATGDNFTFTNIPPGTYTVDFSNFPAGYTPTTTEPVTGVVVPSGGTGGASLGLRIAGGTITGTPWDDSSNHNKIFDPPTEVPLTGSGISIILKDPGGNIIQTTSPNGSGTYTFNSVPVGSGYTVGISPPAGYCGPNSITNGSGWNLGGATGFNYATSSAPFETTNTINVAVGGTTTVNLGVVTDYTLAPNQSSTQVVAPGQCTPGFSVHLDPDPCWIDEAVGFSITNDPALTLNGSRSGSLNPNNPANSTAFTFCAPAGTPPGDYPFTFTTTHPNPSPGRGHNFPGSGTGIITVTPSAGGWISINNGDAYVGYNENSATNAIEYNVPDAPLGGYQNWFLNDTGANLFGGLITAGSGVQVRDASGRNVANERFWVQQSYPTQIPFDINLADFQGLPDCTIQGGIIFMLTPGAACKATSLVPNYVMNTNGVALVFVDSDLVVNNNFINSFRERRRGVIVVASGDITFTSSVGTPATDTTSNLDALFVALGDLIVQGSNTDNNLKVRGGFLAGGAIQMSRTLNNDQYPALVMDYDPVYLINDVPLLSKAQIKWTEK